MFVARRKRRIVAWGTGTPAREFLYVEDAAEGILLAAERYDGAERANRGSGSEISIKELTHLITGLTEFTGEVAWDSSKADGQPRTCLDTGKAKNCSASKEE
jgi:GDP-L-fucose synthase